ncbi:non-specific lipid transfer protein GPI-anchored 16 [Juglans microcarpa x Juglans regia]|uniref:non-specific lipid transfer protein GPI-anchored 16 n=1 Tax=Juglans microcarpa x Juglans regia TaxID=2249226 RepID=UPI001B7DE750|nr:non-specific lipid transfer protein GPI-anchored 16 [Juglans microcarpa x Juglans regia]
MAAVKFSQLAAISATLLVFSSILVNGQISTPCTTSMISSFTPCFSFITGSTSNGRSPTSDCCGSLRSLMGTGMDCACLLLTANVPVPLPINRTLALSLPQACNMGGVPLQCKASGSPLPAKGPVSFGPTPAPIGASPFSPRASKEVAQAPAPQSETTMPSTTPASPPPVVDAEAPTTTSGIRPVLVPSASAPPSYASSASDRLPLLLLLLLGVTAF